MLILLPLLVFAAAFFLFLAREAGATGDLSGWGAAFIRAAVVWGTLVVLFSEGLSPFHALRAGPLALAWAAALALLLGLLARGGRLRSLWALRRSLAVRLSLLEWILLAGLAAEAAVLLAIACVSPPNNTDSLQYHMPRVVHWVEQASLDHYATAFEPQLWHPTWAETAILNLRLLWGSDRPANLVQLFSLLGSIIVTVSIGRLLGVGRPGRFLAAAFAASLPIGILEATGTQNDLVVAFWLSCLAHFALEASRRRLSPLDVALAGCSAGIGLLTKGTFYPYGLIPALWLLFGLWRAAGGRSAVRSAITLGALAGILNMGLWVRNVGTYGHPLGLLGDLGGSNFARLSPGALAASWIENLALNLATPSEEVNAEIVEVVRGLGPEAGRGSSQFGLVWAWNNENLAGNPLHLVTVGVALVGIVGLWLHSRSRELGTAAGYAGVHVASLLLIFSVLDFDIYGVRYQTPFFIAMAPVVGLVAERVARPRAVLVVSLVLLFLGAPWALLNGSRPAIGMKPRTMIDSVFDEGPAIILMANWTDLRDDYFGAAEAVRQSGCQAVGLRLDSHDLEYAYWWLLDAPQSGIRIENIDPPAHLARYVDAEFRPCAIVCMVCGGRTRFHGLDVGFSAGEVSVFLGQRYTLSED